MQFYWLCASQANADSTPVQFKQYSCSHVWDVLVVWPHVCSAFTAGSLLSALQAVW